ncbi:hypothetical protein J2X19_001782 [Rhodoferax ferrireducens]|uniref:DUF3943 domain-containing protein n=1 Tax=Rhodoferax ferrireducens TaxID=192843 RepID=A0ABU2C705_9BURK|nr:DUF3943 domain-containing protein [Rhodoferax ferrireducens]MDR7377124.1 hypothetical protein [Rhodoferax ferrireducens]
MRNATASHHATHFTVVLALACTAANTAYAQDQTAEPATAESATPVTAAEAAPEPAAQPRNYALPALEILGFDFLLNRFNRRFGSSRDDYDVSLGSIRRNLHSSWGVDDDPFKTNQLGHPYQGSMYHGFARSAGFNYWESLGYTFAGSAAWEIAGEKTPPSRNDQISSGIGGTFLGEALFRMSNLVLEKSDGVPRFWREAGAAMISPSTGFNRLLQGRRLDTIFASNNPAYYSRLQVGLMGTAQNVPGTSTQVKRNEAQVDFSLDYGLPGKDGYNYRRPFDYFSFQATASSANVFENVMTRGLLLGNDYAVGKSYRGLWGLYGSYDYISPQAFRISSTALSLGTTGQWRASESVMVQGTAMAGAGYAAVSTINGASDRDYHYGGAPQALLALRVIFSDRSSLDLTGREYFVSGVASGRGGHDNIVRVDVAYTWRVYKQHGITVEYLLNRRDATFPDLGDRTQSRGTVGVFYTLLGHDRFGAVDWR